MDNNTNDILTLEADAKFDPNFRYFGTVKWFNRHKGFGFIRTEELTDNGEERDVFVHYSGILSDFEYKALMERENVYFNLTNDPVKGIVAVNVSKKEAIA